MNERINIILAERTARIALDTAVENLAAARRAAPPFTPMPAKYFDDLDAAREAWNLAYQARGGTD